MTLRGLFVTLLELLIIVLALGTEFKQFLVAALCVGGLMAYSLFSLLLAMLTVSIESSVNKKAVLRGEKVKYRLTVFGMALLPIVTYFSVKTTETEYNSKSRLRHSFIMTPSFSIEHNYTFELPCAHVGLWEIGIKRMRFEDIFGLFSFPLLSANKSRLALKIAVMPQTHDLSADEEKITAGGYGSTGFVNAEEGELLGDTRAYREGDSLKRINWKLSARTKMLQTRQYEMPQKPRVAIIVDKGITGVSMGDIVDISCESAMSIAKYFIEQNNIVDIITVRDKKDNQNTYYNLKSYNDIIKMQEMFSEVEFYKNEKALQFSQYDDTKFLNADKIYLITANPSDRLLSDFCDLDKNNKTARCIVPRAVSLSDYFEQKLNTGNAVRVDITSAELICEKVGGAL